MTVKDVLFLVFVIVSLVTLLNSLRETESSEKRDV